jgi:hypothetical protein
MRAYGLNGYRRFQMGELKHRLRRNTSLRRQESYGMFPCVPCPTEFIFISAGRIRRNIFHETG